MKNTLANPRLFDLIVVGSGGGSKIFTPGAKLGLNVALCERGFNVFDEHKIGLGGTCLNRGCIPSKMLIHAADVATEIKESNKFDINTKFINFDMNNLVTRVENFVDNTSQSIASAYASSSLNRTWFPHSASFVAPKVLQVGDEYISGEYIFLAGGAEPRIPAIHGLKDVPYLTSTEALRLKKQPKKMIIIGSGYIACELGHYFGALGTEVHIFARSVLLRTLADTEVREEFKKVYSSKYNVYEGVKFCNVNYHNEKFSLSYNYNENHSNEDEQGNEEDSKSCMELIEADQLLVCAGVVPSINDLNLYNTNIELTADGYIKVNDYLETSTPNIYSFGDIIGKYLFRHSANFQAEYLLENVIYPLSCHSTPTRVPIDYHGMPFGVFANPQVAGVGLSEDELKISNIEYVKGLNYYKNSAMGDALRSDHGFVKLLIERHTRKILGCFIVGHEATTLIHEILPIIRTHGTLDAILLTIHIHPALNEIVRNAARKALAALENIGDDIPLSIRFKK